MWNCGLRSSSFRLPSLRANGSRECAPDDRLREAIHRTAQRMDGLLRRFAPRNDEPNNDFQSSARNAALTMPIAIETKRVKPDDFIARSFAPEQAFRYLLRM